VSRWRLKLREPVGYGREHGFRIACGPGGSAGPFDEQRPIYSPSPEAMEFRARRQALDLALREAARRVGLSAPELSDLEHGRANLADPEDWPRLLGALEEPA
jgi:hypothetical protein